jgi:hypothetical protein
MTTNALCDPVCSPAAHLILIALVALVIVFLASEPASGDRPRRPVPPSVRPGPPDPVGEWTRPSYRAALGPARGLPSNRPRGGYPTSRPAGSGRDPIDSRSFPEKRTWASTETGRP